MDYSTKPQLRKTIISFLRQRKHLFRELKVPHLENLCVGIEKNFQFIRDWSYWRHCLEVKNAENLLLMILPSEKGGHATERRHMLELIAHCKHVASMTKAKYDKAHNSPTPEIQSNS